MPDTPSIVINKIFTYRGVAEEWSNKYHFTGSTPSSPTEWKALALAIWASERTFLLTDVRFNGLAGYAAGNNTAVALFGPNDLTAGEKTTGALSGSQGPGDSAAWVRWGTGTRGSKGRPIYLRKYFHGYVYNAPDGISSSSRTPMLAYATKMMDGTLPGGAKICAPQGAVAVNSLVPTYVTTRTLKRRGGNPA